MLHPKLDHMLHPTLLRTSLIVLIVAFATISGAWLFEGAGYLPCELCLKQRWAYYAGVPLAGFVACLAAAGLNWPVRVGLVLLGLIFIASAIFGAYHAGIEWGFWQGPKDCTGVLSKAASMDDFLNQLNSVKVVRCDAVAIRILGLSLAGWNAMISTALASLALAGARSSPSTS